jgi:uncharacterized damage-inducible protein DinB
VARYHLLPKVSLGGRANNGAPNGIILTSSCRSGGIDMAIKEAFLGELDYEIRSTRKILERVPAEKMDWQPHPKSMTLRRLASHIAEVPLWALQTLKEDEFDMASPYAKNFMAPKMDSGKEILAYFDKGMEAVLKQLQETGDEQFRRPWTLRMGDQTMFTMQKVAVMRTFIMNHMVHHRAQLSLYLRLLDVPVPSMYGPSADDKG